MVLHHRSQDSYQINSNVYTSGPPKRSNRLICPDKTESDDSLNTVFILLNKPISKSYASGTQHPTKPQFNTILQQPLLHYEY